jgi:hypothetical protein
MVPPQAEEPPRPAAEDEVPLDSATAATASGPDDGESYA